MSSDRWAESGSWWEDAAYAEAETAQEDAVRDMLDPVELPAADWENTRQAGPQAPRRRRRRKPLPQPQEGDA